MTENEKQALALLDEVCEERRLIGGFRKYSREKHTSIEAVCHALEQKAALQAEFDQYKRDVSDAVEKLLEWPSIRSQGILVSSLSRFILPKPKPDPLVEALCCCVPLTSEQGNETPAEYVARSVRKWLADQGLKIKIVEAE